MGMTIVFVGVKSCHPGNDIGGRIVMVQSPRIVPLDQTFSHTLRTLQQKFPFTVLVEQIPYA
jgi:hypothetical protein